MRIPRALAAALLAVAGSAALFARARAADAPDMTERKGLVAVHGEPMTLVGTPVKAGDKAPDFTVADADWHKVTKSDMFRHKILLISVVPNLDTKICTLQTRRFNEEAAKLPDKVAVIAISEDVPATQKRFCATSNIDRIKLYSDVVARDFGHRYGVLIKERGLLARSVWVVDAENTIRYVQLVPEMSKEPDYDKALAAVRKLLEDKPASAAKL